MVHVVTVQLKLIYCNGEIKTFHLSWLVLKDSREAWKNGRHNLKTVKATEKKD